MGSYCVRTDENPSSIFDSMSRTSDVVSVRMLIFLLVESYSTCVISCARPCHKYFVTEATKQSTLTGSEHRRALPFLPFGIAGIAGSPGNNEEHRTLTTAVCELVTLTSSLFSSQCTGRGIVYSEALVLARKAHEWVVGTFQSVLGPVHTTKLHSLSAHLLAEFRLRGNLHDGNSAYNEELHKIVKAAYKTTNRKRGQFAEQMIINEAVSQLLREDEEEELLEQELGEDQSSSSSQCDDEAPRRQCRIRRRRRLQSRRKYSKKRTLAHLASSRAAPGIPGVLRRSAELDQESCMYWRMHCIVTRALCFVPVLPYTSATHPLPAGEECSTRLGARRPSTGRRGWIGCDTGEGMGYCGLAK